ncbi:unnamed protein product [Paramecium pentaurelia]|uniref:SET domain-containing protein n=2 Tax=Paramecium pentaurelia TaxID=43138 RepID=A0A8S1TXL3_9CILI|nr:unnamed protein product [Paramecium pentaurelia]
MSLQRAKRNATKMTYSVEEENESDSSSKQIKKKFKKNTKVTITECKKKVKTQPLLRFNPIAWSRLINVGKVLGQVDTQGILNNDECILTIQLNDIGQQNVYKEWFDEDQKYELDEKSNLIKPFGFKSNLHYLNQFEKRIQNRYYWDNEAVWNDLYKLFGNSYLRCRSQQDYNYLSKVWLDSKVKIKPIIDVFNIQIELDVKNLMEIDKEFKVQTTKWPVIPDKKDIRSYQEIYNYEPNPNQEPYIEQIKEKLSTSKRPIKCDKDCVCFDLSKMGTFSYVNITWDSECPNRKNRVECLEHEGTNQPCMNMSIQSKQHQVNKFKQEENADVEETPCWGIDAYTRKVIMNILPLNYDETQKNKFMEKLLLAINRPSDKENAYDMRLACDYIIKESKLMSSHYNQEDRKMAKQIKKVIKYNPEGFRIHTKGFGLVCVNKQGIKNNSLIIPYLGEIYQPWRWYEKQDFIKKQMKEHNQKDILPDFYNIMLDIHRDDIKGIDFLFVDPINKGNYSSRLSHSCNPNCGTVTTVSNGTYIIGMYAMREIQYGEELTFDYCSFTESKQEQLQALCLCGSEKCKIYYLQLSNCKEYNGILDKEHCFLTRNAILLKSCSDNIDKSNEDSELYSKYRIGSSVLNDCPLWLKNWVGYILKFIDQERQTYKSELNLKYEQTTEVEQWNHFTATQHSEDRIQNLIFTLDKIKFFLNNSDSSEPPISIIGDNDLLDSFWKDYSSGSSNESSFFNELYQLFQKHNQKKMIELIHLIYKKKQQLHDYKENLLYIHKQELLLTRMLFLTLSHMLMQQQYTFHHEALSLILYMMAFTYTYFKPYEYVGFLSPPIEDLEWRKVGAFKKKCKSEGRAYSSQFVWGQLIGWFKQTVAAPQASLSQDRRGTLSYPAISSFDKAGDKAYPFQQSKAQSSRSFFIQHLLDKPSYMWPPETASWSYKNTYKIYGTILFEQFYSTELEEDFLDEVLANHTLEYDQKFQLFVKYESKKFKHSIDLFDKFKDIFQPYIGDNQLNYKDMIVAPLRYRRCKFENNSKRESYIENLRSEGKSEEADLIQKFPFISYAI